jgi:uncharacterized repeat protein (TIGR04138 family)
MEEKKDFYLSVEEIVLADSRYKADAYEFVMQALHFTQNKLKRETHVTGKELAEGIRDYAIEQYGPMAKTVLAHWGIHKTQDFGFIVFNMIEKQMLSKTDSDSLEDFKDVYDFEAAFGNVLRDSTIEGL